MVLKEQKDKMQTLGTFILEHQLVGGSTAESYQTLLQKKKRKNL